MVEMHRARFGREGGKGGTKISILLSGMLPSQHLNMFTNPDLQNLPFQGFMEVSFIPRGQDVHWKFQISIHGLVLLASSTPTLKLPRHPSQESAHQQTKDTLSFWKFQSFRSTVSRTRNKDQTCNFFLMLAQLQKRQKSIHLMDLN